MVVFEAAGSTANLFRTMSVKAKTIVFYVVMLVTIMSEVFQVVHQMM